MAISATQRFLKFIGFPLDTTSLQKLIDHKRAYPQSSDIEQALRAYSNIPVPNSQAKDPTSSAKMQANFILGIFKANFTPLHIRIDSHSPPADENCTDEMFFKIYRRLNQETQDMIQWNIYVPERAKPAYRIPYEDISIDRTDFAVVKIHGTSPNIFGIQSKVRVDHPCLPPIEFTKGIITKAQAVERIMLFPNHESLWKKASALAREYTGTDGKPIRLVSNRCRKFFEDRADSISQKLRPSIAAFIMGDRTKLAATGHLPLFYNPMLKPMERERFIQEYKASEITKLLDLNNY